MPNCHLSVQDVRRLLARDGLCGRDHSGAVGAHGLDGQTLQSKVRSPAGTRFDNLSSRRRKLNFEFSRAFFIQFFREIGVVEPNLIFNQHTFD